MATLIAVNKRTRGIANKKRGGGKANSLFLSKIKSLIRVAYYRSARLSIVYGLEPGWLGASFGLRNCYVRIIIIRWLINY